MALQKSINYKGAQINGAYFKISNVKISKTTFVAEVFCFVNKDQPQPINVEFYAGKYNLNGENPIKQAYEFLKTLPEFVNASDC
jgi:hypothetical protein